MLKPSVVERVGFNNSLLSRAEARAQARLREGALSRGLFIKKRAIALYLAMRIF